jgi:hypothetical protein
MMLDPTRTQEPSSKYTGMKAAALCLTLLGLGWLPLSSAAEAAPFQQYRNAVCTASLICSIDFPVVQAGKRLEISNVSCYLRTSGTVEVFAMQFLVNEGATTKSALSLAPSFVDTTGVPFESVFSTNQSVFVFANAGQRLRAYVELKKGTFSQFACHISGQLQTA